MNVHARSLGGLLFLLLGQLAFVALFLMKERSVPFWDYAMYADMAKRLFFSRDLSFFRQSFEENYNLLFALPSFLSFWLFGASRFVFILTNFVCFFVAQEAALAFVLQKIYKWGLGQSLLWAVGLSCLLPFFWTPMFHGYPDHAAGACLTFALAFFLGTPRSWKEALWIGLFLGLAVLFRRHFAYPCLALLATAFVFDVERMSFRRVFSFYSFLGLVVLSVLILLEPHYFLMMIQTDFMSLYKSYEKGATFFALSFMDRLGFFLFLSVLAGYVLAYRAFAFSRRGLLFVLCFFFVWFVLWAFGPSQIGEHYFLSATPVFCLVGLTGLFLCLRRRFLLVCFSALLIGNSAYALWFASDFLLPNEPPRPSFFSAPQPPWVRDDYETLKNLALYLEQTTAPSDKIAVVSSSFVLNQDLVRVLYEDVLKKPEMVKRFLFVSEIDRVQGPSFHVLASATVFVVPDPSQYHLDPRGQSVLTALSSFFPPTPPFHSFFKKDARNFSLSHGVTATLWRRALWQPQALHLALSRMRQKADESSLWVVAAGSSPFGSQAATSEFLFLFTPDQPAASLFFDRPLEAGAYRLAMEIASSSGCHPPRLTVHLRNEEGASLLSKQSQPVQNPGLLFMPFVVESLPKTPAFLFLEIQPQRAAAAACSVALWRLRVEEMEKRGLPTTHLKD